jgi:L-threonylcarbamoyladenylate synthase
LEDVKKVLGAGGQCDWRKGVKEGETPRSPGMKYTHYSPEAEVIMYEGDNELVKRNIKIAAMSCLLKGEKVGVMTVDENAAFYEMMPNVLSLGRREDSLSQASNLFRLLREFDERGVAKVFAEALPTGGVGDAVMNRLYRACGGNVINCDG